MNKKLLLLFATTFCFTNLSAQVLSIRPDTAVQGQSLTTYITLAAGTFSVGSPPFGNTDVYLQQGGTTIYCDPSFNTFTNVYQGCVPFYCDSLFADFDIPGGAPNGYYDVHVISYDMFGTPIDNLLPSGFFIGELAGTIEGDIYFDTNQNGIWDGGEPPLMNHRAVLNPGGLIAYSNAAGHYKSYCDTGTYTVSYLPDVSFTQTSVPLTYSATVPPDYTGFDFGSFSSQSLYDQYFYVWHHPMRCFPSYGYTYVDIANNGFLAVQGSITMVHSNNMIFNNSIPAPDIISGDTLTWYYGPLNPGQSVHIGGALNGWISFVDPPAGQTIWFNTVDSVFDLLGNPLTQYADSFSFLVTCSCDPNDKNVFPPGESPAHITPPGSILDYTINFQNTGNDTAFTVVIKDTLDANLDWNTFELLSSTHTVQAQMDVNGILTFTYDNILLPDSNIDEPGSHGAVAYRIAVDSLLPDPTTVYNTAHIFFDANPAVVTNTAFNTLTVLEFPVAAFTTSVTSLCPGTCIDFTNQSTNATSYLWTFNGSATPTSTSQDPTNICYNTPGSYNVTLEATNVLGTHTISTANYITIFPYSPTQSIVQIDDSLISNQGFASYQWYYQGNIIPGATSYWYVAVQTGDYSVVCLDSNGCSVEAVILNVVLGLDALSTASDFSVYPNPAGDYVIIRSRSLFAGGVSVMLFNSLGQKALTVELSAQTNQEVVHLDISSLEKGIYTIEIVNSRMVSRGRFLKN